MKRKINGYGQYRDSESKKNEYDQHKENKSIIKRKKVVVNIDGNIGSGKTTIIQKIIRCLDGQIPIFLIDEEFVNTEEGQRILDSYYKNKKKAYEFNKYILFSISKRLNRLADELENEDDFIVLFDRSIITNFHVFIKMNYKDGNINQNQYDYLFELYGLVLKKYKLIVLHFEIKQIHFYIKESIETLLENIKNRGRESEKDIDSSFLEKVEKYHKDVFEDWDNIPLIKIGENEKKLPKIMKEINKFFENKK